MSTETKPAEWILKAAHYIAGLDYGGWIIHGTREDNMNVVESHIAYIIAKHAPPESEAIEALRVLVNIADAYDANELDDEARKFWGLNDEHQNKLIHRNIELYAGRGGKQLLTLEDCMKARAILARHVAE